MKPWNVSRSYNQFYILPFFIYGKRSTSWLNYVLIIWINVALDSSIFVYLWSYKRKSIEKSLKATSFRSYVLLAINNKAKKISAFDFCFKWSNISCYQKIIKNNFEKSNYLDFINHVDSFDFCPQSSVANVLC